MWKTKFITVLALIVSAALIRVIPHWPNFTPIVALALFGGKEIRSMLLSVLVVFGSMFLSDAILGFHPVMWATYLALGLIVLVGHFVKDRASSIALATIGSSFLFFVVSNFGVWISGWLYPRTVIGLSECFVAAIPFFGYSLLGDLFYSAVIFSIYQLVERRLVACSQA